MVLKRDACHFGKQHSERSLKMYFAEVSSQAPIVLTIFILYIFHILLYAYVCVKCTKLFVHTYAEYVFFNFFINTYIGFKAYKASVEDCEQ